MDKKLWCCIWKREPDWVDPIYGVTWRHTGASGYYLLLNVELTPNCFVSNLPTNYVDIHFEAPLHPDYYEQAWNDYIKTVQPSHIGN